MGAPERWPASGARQWPGLRSEYARLAPHEGPTVTGPNQVGVAFTAHRGLPWESGGRTVEADIPAGSTIVTGGVGISWLRVREPTEALEMYPAPDLLRAVAAPWHPAPVETPPMVGTGDAVVLGIGSVLRRVHATDAYLSDVAASTLANRLAIHLLSSYCGMRSLERGRGDGRLDARTVARVAEFVDARLGSRLALDQLASVARLSPFHFARAFKSSTGLTPHGFVTSRRMDRARNLLLTGRDPVDEVARMVGFTNVSHFRRVFRRHVGLPPSALRR